jgi:hypothetical protein
VLAHATGQMAGLQKNRHVCVRAHECVCMCLYVYVFRGHQALNLAPRSEDRGANNAPRGPIGLAFMGLQQLGCQLINKPINSISHLGFLAFVMLKDRELGRGHEAFQHSIW